MLSVPWYKEIASYLLPITIFKEYSEQHESLKIMRYQGQWLLESKEALYSSGSSYKPFKLGFEAIEKELKRTNNFLLLGAGLCSAVKILQEKYDHFPSCDIIDYDDKILALNKSIPTLISFDQLHFHCYKAEDYLAINKIKYDLIGVDLFKEMEMAPIVQSNKFLEQLKRTATARGKIIINTIFQDEKGAKGYQEKLAKHFDVSRIDYNPNYIFICKPLI